MNFRPNEFYYKVKIKLFKDTLVSFFCKNQYVEYRLDDNIEVPEFFLTEKQYITVRRKIVEAHIKVEIRKMYEFYNCSEQKMDVSPEGELLEDTWELTIHNLKPSEFSLVTAPYYTQKIECYQTDGEGNLIRINA